MMSTEGCALKIKSFAFIFGFFREVPRDIAPFLGSFIIPIPHPNLRSLPRLCPLCRIIAL